MHATYVEEVIC